MSLRASALVLAGLFVSGTFATGLAAGKAWGRATAKSAVESADRARLRSLEEELLALDRQLARHAEAQRQLAEQALDCRVATAGRRMGKGAELARLAP